MTGNEMKRRKRAGAPGPDYPTADAIARDRRRFLEMVGRGVLGISILGVTRCDKPAGGGSAGDAAAGDAGLDAGPGELWGPQGVAPADTEVPDTIGPDHGVPDGLPPRPEEVTTLPDTAADTETWSTGGVPRPPDTLELDVVSVDGCTATDAEGEFPPLAGDLPAPDTTDPDTVSADTKPDAFPPVDGDMPAPEPPRRAPRRR